MLTLLSFAIALALQSAAGAALQFLSDRLNPHQAALNRLAARNLKAMHDAGFF